MKKTRQIASILVRYLIRLVRLWLFWCWFVALDALGLVVDTFFPDCSPPRWIYWTIPILGFLLANVKLFADQETRIAELTTDKTDALNAVIQEIETNLASAVHNAALRGNAKLPGSLPFERLKDYICRETLLKGRFVLDPALIQVARKYVQVVNRVNTLIASVEATTSKFQNAGGTADRIRRYCSKGPEPIDDETEGLPHLMDELQELIEREIANTSS